MISSVVITGLLKQRKNECFRILETHTNDAFHPEVDIISEVPVMYWTRDDSNPLMNAPDNSFIVIKGRLENDKNLGLYVLAETIEFMRMGQ